jgi:dTDP-4-dehydrorhamnose 3,5-epimerase
VLYAPCQRPRPQCLGGECLLDLIPIATENWRERKVETTMDTQSVIEGVKIIPLRQIVDERGKIMHMLKATDPHFISFGEIYFSCAWPGTVKAWHIHTSMTVNNAVLSGRAKLVIYDLRKDSPTKGKLQEIFLGEDNYCLVQIPPGLANGYKAYGDKMVILANCASEPHRPEEMIRMDPFTSEIPYNWTLQHG